MTDLAALGRTDTTGFTGGERREVVMQHEAVFVFTRQGIDDLLVSRRAQGNGNQRLRFTAGK